MRNTRHGGHRTVPRSSFTVQFVTHLARRHKLKALALTDGVDAVKSGDGFLLVFDLTNMRTLSELESIRDQINRVKETEYASSASKPPICLVGNKCDLSDARQVPREVAVGVASRWKCPYYETSARQNVFVEEIFEDLVRQIRYSGVSASAANGTEPRKTKRKGLKRCTIL